MENWQRILVFSAHPDDEILGVGGTIARLSDLGKEVYVVTFAIGETSYSSIEMKERMREIRLKEAEDALKEFSSAIEPIIQKTSVYLLQMPPSYIPDIGQMDTFFSLWFTVFPNSRLALELRNRKAFSDDTFELLKKRGVCLVLEDYKGCEIDDVVTTHWIYIRRHGPSGRYRGKYDEAQLQKDAKKIKNWLKKGMDVYVFFNNDFGGYAPENALQLMSLMNKECLKRKKEVKKCKVDNE